MSHDLHFWIGNESSQDEYGVAAVKAVELDDQLGGGPIQHREVQGHESSLFEAYFKNGIKYLPGGVKSGFSHVDPDADVEKRLFLVKGKRNIIRVKQVAFCLSSLNKSDSFILDCGKGQDILVYMPEGSSRMERFKATQIANDIRDEDHAGNATVEIIDAFSDESSKFFELLGGCSSSGDDISDLAPKEEQAEIGQAVLYKVSGEEANLDINEIGAKHLDQNMLDQQASTSS